MKTYTTLGLGAAALLGLAASTNAQSSGIVNTGHNFSSAAWSDGEICKPCHTPHFAMAGQPRLWNHELTTATYQMHEGPGTAEDDFDFASRMCLSCHDGTVALDSFGGQTGNSFITPNKNLGTDLTDDHPVGADGQYPPTPQPSWWAGSFKPESSLPSTLRLKTWTDSGGVDHKVVGCTTCHNAHGKGYDDLLTMSNAASALCLGCHIK
jgi:predicted CXXCH cytochrome family protein